MDEEYFTKVKQIRENGLVIFAVCRRGAVIAEYDDFDNAVAMTERLNLQARMLREQVPPDPPWKDKPLTGGLDVSTDGKKGWHPW